METETWSPVYSMHYLLVEQQALFSGIAALFDRVPLPSSNLQSTRIDRSRLSAISGCIKMSICDVHVLIHDNFISMVGPCANWTHLDFVVSFLFGHVLFGSAFRIAEYHCSPQQLHSPARRLRWTFVNLKFHKTNKLNLAWPRPYRSFGPEGIKLINMLSSPRS